MEKNRQKDEENKGKHNGWFFPIVCTLSHFESLNVFVMKGMKKV